jgi:predicted GNAT family acetyltransferase
LDIYIRAIPLIYQIQIQSMEIKNEEHHHAGIFYIDDKGERLGEMRYLTQNGVMNIYHTEVSEQLQGKHMGEKLVEAGVNFARENHLKILPNVYLCAVGF